MTNQNETHTEAEATLTRHLDYYIEAANKARAEFAAKLADTNHLYETLSAFEWSRETIIAVTLGNLAANVKAVAEQHDVPLTEALARVLQGVQTELMGNRLAGRGGSHMSNATEHTMREAYSRFYDRLA